LYANLLAPLDSFGEKIFRNVYLHVKLPEKAIVLEMDLLFVTIHAPIQTNYGNLMSKNVLTAVFILEMMIVGKTVSVSVMSLVNQDNAINLMIKPVETHVKLLE